MRHHRDPVFSPFPDGHTLLTAEPTAAMPRRGLIAVVGGGPAGLMAAEAALEQGADVHLYDAMGSVGRKFLLAGKGGLNLTHGEAKADFLRRYAPDDGPVQDWLAEFGADALRAWARELGVETVIGSSGRVFPADFKAAPLLRGWLRRLRERGLRLHMHHRFTGWQDGALRFATPEGERMVAADRQILALGGASWPVLGSDGAWVARLREAGVAVHDLLPSNVGYECRWSEHFRERFAGQPLKPVALRVGREGPWRQGELLIADYGLEGSLLYALGQALRAAGGSGGLDVEIDLLPGVPLSTVAAKLAQARGGRSLSEHLRRKLGLTGARAALLREALAGPPPNEANELAALLKALPLHLDAPRPIAEAISSAGGVAWEELDDNLRLHRLPHVYCAGEMLDWDAPTGGYLLTACFASGRRAGRAAALSLPAP
jgi:uncharacterized flavoprotein (TIGR03862 family)